jgi:tripartite ATP-independent transporter DctP family solute receptor
MIITSITIQKGGYPMKKLIIYLVSITATIFIYVEAGAQKVQNADAPIKMGLATEPSKPDMTALLADKFFELVKEKSKGKVEVTLFIGGALGSQKQLQEQINLGTIQSIVTASDIVEMDNRFGIFDFPFLFSDREKLYSTLDGNLGNILNEGLIQKRGVRVLAFGELGFRQITNNIRPINTPSDFEGMRIRVPPTKLRVETFKALGASPTPISWGELYQAMQQRVVDGQENPLSAIFASSFFEVQKFLSISNHVYTPAYLLVNEKWYKNLPDNVKQQLKAAANEAVQWQRSYGREQEKLLIDQLKEKRMEVNYINQSSFIEKAKPVWTNFSDQIGRDIYEIAIQSTK